MIDKEKLIIKFLKKNGISSTNRVATAIKSNAYIAEEYLLKLYADGKITKLQTPSATYWEIRKKRPGSVLKPQKLMVVGATA